MINKGKLFIKECWKIDNLALIYTHWPPIWRNGNVIITWKDDSMIFPRNLDTIARARVLHLHEQIMWYTVEASWGQSIGDSTHIHPPNRTIKHVHLLYGHVNSPKPIVANTRQWRPISIANVSSRIKNCQNNVLSYFIEILYRYLAVLIDFDYSKCQGLVSMSHLTWELELLYPVSVFQCIVTYQPVVAKNDKTSDFRLRLVCLNLPLNWMKERTKERMNKWNNATYFWPRIVDKITC